MYSNKIVFFNTKGVSLDPSCILALLQNVNISKDGIKLLNMPGDKRNSKFT